MPSSDEPLIFTKPAVHYAPLTNPLPAWLGKASPARLQALKANRRPLTEAVKNAPQPEHAKLREHVTEHMAAQNEIDQTLARLQDAKAFAEPILKAALKTRFGQDLDVRSTCLRLYIPVTTPAFPIKTGARVWTVSLLDAALHNFEERETRATAYETESTFITQPSPSGQFDTLPLLTTGIGIPAFTQLCRELDIGGQYKTYLEDNLGISNRLVAAVLPPQVKASQNAALRAALQLARMNGGLLEGLQGMRVDGQALCCHDLAIMSASLTGILVFAADLEQARASVRVVAYVPDDPEHPIKEYASTTAMMLELTRQLRSSDYQQFFSRFVAHEERGYFFADLNRRLSHVTWHQVEKGSALPSWRETPIERPNLQFSVTPIRGELWRHLYTRSLDKILNDAAVIAVSTATVDRNARWALWDSFVKIASSILEIAAFVAAPFVPFLGEMMMAYMTYQLLNEFFEGVVDWSEGQTREAGTHLLGVVESLVQLGTFAVGGVIAVEEVPKILPAQVRAFVDRFKPVKLRNGKTLFWQPDLTRYRQPPPPANAARPDPMGLIQHNGHQLLPLEQACYAVSPATEPGRYLIKHPSRPDAYQPSVFHNGDGAWHTELEQPLEWDTTTALRRLGHHVESFSIAERERILHVSGYPAQGLRRMHANRQTTPLLLADSITRFKIDQDLQRFIDQLSSTRPSQYLQADPVQQLQLLSAHPRWSHTRRLQFRDERGEILWQSSSAPWQPLTLIKRHQLVGGDVLKTLVQALPVDDVKGLVGEEFGITWTADARTKALREQLVGLAKARRTELFDERYQALQHTDDPLTRRIVEHTPNLPVVLARELRVSATGEELLEISQGRWPQRQQTLAAQADQELRVARAYEGLELDSMRSTDADTLALHSLARLKGWSNYVRLEIRDRTYEGLVLDSTGPVTASIRKVLVR